MKILDILLIGLLTSLAAISVEVIVPVVDVISRDMGIPPQSGTLVITVFILGMACGEFIAGPLSDAYGRRAVLLPALLIFLLASASASIAADLPTLLLLRFVQALASGAASGMTIPLIGDRFELTDTSKFLSLAMVVAMASRVVAPIAGYRVSEAFGWQSIFLCLAFMGLALI